MALGNVVARLLVRLGIDKKEFDAGTKQAESQAKGLKSSLNEVKGSSDLMTGALKAAGMLGMAYLAKEAASLVVDLARTGAEFSRLSASFEDLVQQAGGNADALLAAMKKATAGTVSEMDLILAANKGMLLGLGADTEQWADLMEVARYRARAMGISMTQAVDDITTAIGRESKMIADNLGIIWDMDQVMGDYAASLGKTADELTGVERKQALMTETIRIGQAQIEAAGGIADDSADQFARMEAAIEDAKTAIGIGLAPVVADVAEAIADLLPKALAAAEGLAILAAAGVEWAKAALAGEDAERAFDAAVAGAVGTAEQAARAKLNLAEANLALAEAELAEADARAETSRAKLSPGYGASLEAQAAARARLEAAQAAYDAALKEVEANTLSATAHHEATGAAWAQYDATLALAEGLVQLPPGAYAAMNAMQDMAGQMMESASSALALRDALDDLNDVSADEIGTQFSSAASKIESGLSRLAGDTPLLVLRGLRNQYIAELSELYAGANNLTEFELSYREQLIMNAFDDEVEALQDAADAEEKTLAGMADSYSTYANSIRGAIESALTPTTVTALDMGLAGIGEYTEKWDENARRLDAIAARGFAELEAHPDWAALLQIPENVLAAGEDALKSWASGMADDVRNLFRPDLLNVSAAADAVEAYMQEQAAKELSIDLVIGELVARGGMTQADAEAQVRQAYGLDTEPVDIPIQLVSAVSGDEGGEGWGAAADELVQGITDGITDSSIVAEFVAYFRKDITNNETMLNNAGEALWDTVEVGILVRLDRADYATLFVSKLGPLVGAWLLENQGNTQGGGEP